MRSALPLVLGVSILAGGCDRQSPAPAQGNAAAAASPEEVSPDEVSPDEAQPAASAAQVGSFDRSQAGTAAPTAVFTDPAGKRARLADYRGKPVLVNLWATWCAPCIKEMPTLDTLAARGGVTVLAISQDMDAAKVAPFWAKGGYKALRPSRDPALGFSAGLKVSLPTTILYDAAGKEVWRLSGTIDWAGAEAAKAIAEAR